MCVCATAKRRRKQAANGFKHLDKKSRPIYKKRSKEASAARLARLIAEERARTVRKGMKK